MRRRSAFGRCGPYNSHMSSYYRSPYSGGGGFALPTVTPMVKRLIWVLAVCFFVQTIVEFLLNNPAPTLWLGLSLPMVLERFAYWQFVTYGFLHGDLLHLIFNLLGLWMFGGDVERLLGSRGFLRYLLICVAGGGLVYILVALWTQSPAPVVGVSAGILGLVVAFAVFFPDREMFLFPLPFPIKARTIALIFGAMDLYSAIVTTSRGGTVGSGGRVTAFTAHLGGMLIGLLYLQLFVRRGGGGIKLPFGRRRPFRVVHGDRDDRFNLH